MHMLVCLCVCPFDDAVHVSGHKPATEVLSVARARARARERALTGYRVRLTEHNFFGVVTLSEHHFFGAVTLREHHFFGAELTVQE